MKRRIQLAIVGLLLTGVAAQSRLQGKVIDGIAAVIDGRALTQSEVEDSAWFEQLSKTPAAPAAATLTPAAVAAALQHTIDADVVMQACANEDCDGASDAQVEAQWQHLAQLGGGDAALRARLGQYHLSETTVRTILRRQLTMLAFIDDRVSDSIVVGDPDIQNYYDTVFAPAARAQGLAPAPLTAVRTQIETILRQRQLGAAEDQFIARLRADAKVELRQP